MSSSQPTTDDDLQADKAQLCARIERLEAEIARRDEADEKAAQRALSMRRAASQVFMGWELRRTLRTLSDGLDEWFVRRRDEFPRHEAADAFAALVQRIVRVSALGFLLAVLPLGILTAQTTIMWQQNQYFQEQNRQIQQQLDFQTEGERRARRTQLLGVLYEKAEGCQEVLCRKGAKDCPGATCPPRADKRARSEAARAFIQLALQEKKGLDLRDARLQETDLRRTNLKRALLSGANLKRANLTRANLTRADLSGANLSGADFTDANLTRARLKGADLSRVTWSNTTCPDGSNSDDRRNTCE